MYFITEGLLAKGHDALTPRLEFRDVLNGRYTIVALHDFMPVLPWGLYFVTQAVVHLIVMRNFQKYMAKMLPVFLKKTDGAWHQIGNLLYSGKRNSCCP